MLYPVERDMGFRRALNQDPVSGPDPPAPEHDRHDAALPDQVPGSVPVEQGFHQPRLQAVELCAGIAQARYPDQGRVAELQLCAQRELQQGDSTGKHIFSHRAGGYAEAFPGQLLEQLFMDQMHLPQVGLIWVLSHARAVLHLRTHMCIPRYAETGDQLQLRHAGFTEAMCRGQAQGSDEGHGAKIGYLQPPVDGFCGCDGPRLPGMRYLSAMPPVFRCALLGVAILIHIASAAVGSPADSLLELARSTADPQRRDALHYDAGLRYYYAGAHDSALGLFARTRTSSDPELRVKTLNAIGNIYADRGESPKALELYRQALDEALAYRAVLAERRRMLKLYISLGAVLALGAIFGLIYRNRRIRDRLNEERQVAQAMIDAEQRERIRVARDLHDNIGQMLAVLRMQVSGLEKEVPDAARDRAVKTAELVDRAASEVRGISHNLIPEELNYGLSSAIRSLCEKISTAGSLQAFAEIAEPLRHKKFSIHFELALYKIIQEVLAGMIRQSGASIIRIRIDQEQRAMRILVQDNGRGFGTARVTDSEGLGWKNIAARARLLQGRMEVSSEREQGNQVSIRIPDIL